VQDQGAKHSAKEHLEASHAGTNLERFVAWLRADIEADPGVEAIMARFDVSESRPRKALTLEP